MSADRLYQCINPAGAIAIPLVTTSTPPPAPAAPGRRIACVLRPVVDRAIPVKARIYRIPQDPDDPELRPCWTWRCQDCRTQSNGCRHELIHTPGTWQAAMCGGFHHIHVQHPRPVPPGVAACTSMYGRTRCSDTPPTVTHRRIAAEVLAGALGRPAGVDAREFAREVLAFAGQRTPG